MQKKSVVLVSALMMHIMISNALAANCVTWVRKNRAPWLPSGMTYYSEKISKKGFKAKPKDVKAGDVVVMNIYPPYGHVAYVKSVKKDKLTIEESNVPIGTEYATRTKTAKEMKVVGFYRK